MRKTVRGWGNGNGRTRNGNREWECALRGWENEKDSAGMGMAEHGMTTRNGNVLCGEGRMRKTVWDGVMGMTEHGMAAGNGNVLCGEGRMRKTVHE